MRKDFPQITSQLITCYNIESLVYANGFLSFFLLHAKGRCCPVYDRRLGRVREDYNSPCSECPFKYQSDDLVKCELSK